MTAQSGEEPWRVQVEHFHKLVNVADVPGRGRALIAGGGIEGGTALVRERPLVVAADSDAAALAALTGALEADAQPGSDGRFTHLCRLPQPSGTRCPDQEDLSNPSATSSTAAQQVKANAFGGLSSNKSLQLSLFSAISFCNHSCAPNAAVSRASTSERPEPDDSPLDQPHLGVPRTLYTLRNIAEGEEICICYDSDLLWLLESARRHHTTTVWAFKCECQRCAQDRTVPDLDSFTGIERYYDAFGRLTSGVIMQPESIVSDSQPCVVDIYEEAHQFYGPSHWRTHAARDKALRVFLDKAPQDFDFEMLLEHLQEIVRLVSPSHPYFLTWFATMEQIVRGDPEGVGSVPEWQRTIEQMQHLVRSNVSANVLMWNGVTEANDNASS
mmetsp:Transcript_39274/g.100342  ORF Transcript_39274/g.100342 Transcript_39274/m.100342 type:complete len:385 (+) Transcript_39274:212-1366(+)